MQLATDDKLTPELKSEIDYIITLGGDGTILWASKQFSGPSIPPMITFAQGSLGFLCNFTFIDHGEVLKHVFQSVKDQRVSEELGIDQRMRLRINMGEGEN